MSDPKENARICAVITAWLRFKSRNGAHLGFAHPADQFTPYETPARVLMQLAADIDHSFLLRRMLAGYDPLLEEEYEEWKANDFAGWFDYLEKRKTP